MDQNSIQLPSDLYDAVRRRAVAQQKSPDALVTEWVAEQLETVESDELEDGFEAEAAAFDLLRDSLLEQFGGQYVAVYQGKVVASGRDPFALLRQVHQEFGPVPCYIDLVKPDNSIRKVRIPSAWMVRS
ncbi:MAG: hypothetical protein Fur0021_18150 [Candidatus Promineifilaceae bacterium]